MTYIPLADTIIRTEEVRIYLNEKRKMSNEAITRLVLNRRIFEEHRQFQDIDKRVDLAQVPY